VKLFGRDDPPKSPQPTGPDYTIDTVREHLETIGMFRLQVHSADMKVCLTLIAWNGEPYLMQRSTGGTPSGVDIIRLCKQLETVERVMAEFKQIEEANPPNATELLAQGLQGTRDFAFRLSGTTAAGATRNVPTRLGYTVDTQMLSTE